MPRDVRSGVDFADEEGGQASGGVEQYFNGKADDIVAAGGRVLSRLMSK